MEMLGQVLGSALLLAGGVLAVISLLATLRLLVPRVVEPIRCRLDQGLAIPFVVGLGMLVVVGGTAVALMAASDLGDPGPTWLIAMGIAIGLLVLLLAVFATLAIYGLAALASLLGQRQGEACRPFRADLCGGLLLILACLAPFVGWLLFTPFAVCTSLGGALIAIFRRPPAPPPAAAG